MERFFLSTDSLVWGNPYRSFDYCLKPASKKDNRYLRNLNPVRYFDCLMNIFADS